MGNEGYFDADNHYYEAEDAFTRYQSRDMANRCMQWVDLNGRRRLLVAGTVNRFIANPTFDPPARAVSTRGTAAPSRSPTSVTRSGRSSRSNGAPSTAIAPHGSR
jgi:hypothetical protein